MGHDGGVTELYLAEALARSTFFGNALCTLRTFGYGEMNHLLYEPVGEDVACLVGEVRRLQAGLAAGLAPPPAIDDTDEFDARAESWAQQAATTTYLGQAQIAAKVLRDMVGVATARLRAARSPVPPVPPAPQCDSPAGMVPLTDVRDILFAMITLYSVGADRRAAGSVFGAALRTIGGLIEKDASGTQATPGRKAEPPDA